MAEIVIDIIGKDSFSGVLGNFGNIMTGIKSTIDLVSGAFNAAVGAVSPFIDAATESENAVANLEATLKSTGNAVGLTSQQLQDMASGFQNVTKFSDDTIINGEAMLLTFTNIGKDVFPAATEAMLNLAEKFGSVDSASVQLGKALNDPVAGLTALSRVGVSFTEEQKETIKTMVEMGDVAGAQGVILAELEKEFGGLAEAMGDTTTGKMEIFKNKLGEVQETIGKALLPVLGNLMDWAMQFMPIIEAVGASVSGFVTELASGTPFLDALSNALKGFGGDDTPAFVVNIALMVDWIKSAWEAVKGFAAEMMIQLQPALDNFGSFFATFAGSSAPGSIVTMLQTLGTTVLNIAKDAIPFFIEQFTKFSQWFKDNGPAISQRIADIADFFTHTLIPALSSAWNAVKPLISGLADLLITLGNFFYKLSTIGSSALDFFKDFFPQLGKSIIDAIKSIFGIASPSTVFIEIGKNIIQGLINGIEAAENFLLNAIKALVSKMIEPFQPILDFLGIDTSFLNTSSTSTGSVGGGTSNWPGGGGTTGSLTGASITNNFYAPVYVGSMAQLSGFDCPPDNALTGSTGGFVPVGIH